MLVNIPYMEHMGFKDGSMYYRKKPLQKMLSRLESGYIVIMMDMRPVIGKAKKQCFANKLQMVQPNCGK